MKKLVCIIALFSIPIQNFAQPVWYQSAQKMLQIVTKKMVEKPEYIAPTLAAVLGLGLIAKYAITKTLNANAYHKYIAPIVPNNPYIYAVLMQDLKKTESGYEPDFEKNRIYFIWQKYAESTPKKQFCINSKGKYSRDPIEEPLKFYPNAYYKGYLSRAPKDVSDEWTRYQNWLKDTNNNTGYKPDVIVLLNDIKTYLNQEEYVGQQQLSTEMNISDADERGYFSALYSNTSSFFGSVISKIGSLFSFQNRLSMEESKKKELNSSKASDGSSAQ